MGWALADLLKDASATPDASPARLLRGLDVIRQFPMVADDGRWQESVLWSVNRFLLRVRPERLSLADLAALISQARVYVPLSPTLVRSVWWKALLRHSAAGIDWLGLFDELGWDGGFRPEDAQPEPYGEGKVSRPLVEGLMQAVAKQLLQTVPLSDEQATPWLTRLAELAEQHTDWPYLPYYQAKLLLRLNQPSEAMRVFLPFARRKQRDFWVWSLLADLQPESATDRRWACLAYALTLGTPESYVVKVRQRLAALLIGLDRWGEARVQIERLVQTRQAENWPLPAEVVRWQNDTQYTQASPGETGEPVRLIAQARALLWEDQPTTVVLVTSLDPTGHYCNVALDEQTTGSFPCRKFGLQPAVGDRLAIRYEMRTKGERMQLHVLTAEPTTAGCTHLHLRTVTGPLRRMPNRNVGFVVDVYVPTEVMSANPTLAGQLVSVDAFASWDRGQKKMGWRAYQLREVS